MTEPLGWIDESLRELERDGLLRKLRTRANAQGPVVEVDGHRLINFGSNDYLGLAGRLKQHAHATDPCGWGSGASPLVLGRSSSHAALEAALADFEGVESALLFPSGYAANVGTITALVGKGDAVFSDEKNHASIIDGCRLSRARVHVYQHCDLASLSDALRDASDARRRLVVTDALFSMDGDVAPLPGLVELADRYSAMVMIDEAHSTGVFGERGRGVSEHFGVEQDVHVRVGTLSKALGSIGGFVVGSRNLIDWLLNRARPYVFSTAMPDAAADAGAAAVRLIEANPGIGRQLLDRARRLRAELVNQGWSVGRSESQIVPVIIGDPQETVAFAEQLHRRGMFVPAIRPPSVPEGSSLLRISLSAAHDEQMVDQLVAAFRELRADAESSVANSDQENASTSA